MQLITDEYARENARLHSVDDRFGVEGYLWAYHVAGIALVEGCESVLDYGCGKGTLAKELEKIQPSRFDTYPFVFYEYDPGVPGKDCRPSPADLVVSLDVLEHIEPEFVDNVLRDLARLARKKLFVVISTKRSKRLMADGRDTHLSLHDDAWWHQLFIQHEFTVDRVWNTGLRLWVALLSPPC